MNEAILDKMDFEKLLEMSFENTFKVADLVEGTIVKIEKSGILVDVGGKTEALLPLWEISNLPFENPGDVISEGEKKKFYIVSEANEEGQIKVSLKRVHLAENWAKLEEARRSDATVEVKVASLVKGGVIAEIYDLRGFIPASQLRTGTPHENLISQTLCVKVLEADPKRNKLILSERLCVQEERKKIAVEVIASLEEDQVIEGEIVRLADFGAFIDVNGIDGLLPISEICWHKVKHPSDVLTLGEKIKVKVLRIDRDLNRISLSRKRMEENPWVQVESRFEEGQVIKGVVNKITDFGAFVCIFPGVEALLPVAEMSQEHVNPYEMLSVTQEIEVLIKKFTPREKRIGLSIKDLNRAEQH